MNKIGKYVVASFAIGIMVAALSGCDKGPAEKTGAAIDNAVEKTGQQVEKAGDKIEDATKK
jgi:predicted small lipoprotein YifL